MTTLAIAALLIWRVIVNWRNVLVAVDQLGTTLVGGYADETLSSYAHRMRLQGKPFGFTATVIDWLFRPLESDHCRKAFEAERERRHVPPQLREP